MTRLFLSLIGFFLATQISLAEDAFRVWPYLQSPAKNAITVCWFTGSNQPGRLTVELPDGSHRELVSSPQPAPELGYNPFGQEPGGPHPAVPFKHRLRVTDLSAGTTYRYTVVQGDSRFTDEFQTAPDKNTPIRAVFYADSETEPESSTSPPVDWPVGKGSNRPEGMSRYVVKQTQGYIENLKLIESRKPNFISVVGDLVESGGEQRDWDEFWKHNAGEYGRLAGHIPLLAALGNHENYGGPGDFGGYSAKAADYAVDKYLTYFEFPSNNARDPKHVGRYYRIDYGPITLITVDSSDGQPAGTAADSNHNLSESHAADFNPGSAQYAWLEQQLADAQRTSRFTLVQYHHTAYGSGPHSIPFGQSGFSGQSGIALRVLQPLFLKYGVDAVISGHDEMLERSMVQGEEKLPDGRTLPHQIPYYDVGIGGDGLRGASAGFQNPYRKFLAHDDLPEVWAGRQLKSGGKHYGHLELDVAPDPSGQWSATLSAVQVFPLMNPAGEVLGFERRVVDEVIQLRAR